MYRARKVLGTTAALLVIIIAALWMRQVETPESTAIAPPSIPVVPSTPPMPAAEPDEPEAVRYDESQPPISGGGGVSGRVLFRDTGQPAPNVVVVALERRRDGGQMEITSDAEGRYSFTGLPPEVTYALCVSNVPGGYVAVEFPRVRIEAEQVQENVDILLSTGGSISGQVCTWHPSMGPLSDARVTVRLVEPLGPILRETTSAADGTYTLAALPAGRFMVMCQPPKGQVGLVRDLERNSVRRVGLHTDEHLQGVGFSFFPGLSVSGHVTGFSGSLEDAQVRAAPRSLEGGIRLLPVQTITGDDGRYVLEGLVPLHTYVVSAVAGGCQPVAREIRLGREGATGVDFGLDREAVIAGQIIDDRGSKLSESFVRVEFLTPKEEWFENHPMGFPPPLRIAGARADREGCFQVGKLPPGEYAFHVALKEWGKKCLPSSTPPVTVYAGQRLENVVVVVPDTDRNFIEGRVLGTRGQPLPGIAVSAGSGYRDFIKTVTDDSGRYRLEGLGTAPVVVSFRGESYGRLRLTDVPIGSSNVDIVLGHEPGTIAGVVVDAKTGAALDGAEAKIAAVQPPGASYFSHDPRPREVSVQTGPGPGQFVIENVPAGFVTLRAVAPGYTPDESVQVEVRSGRTTKATIPLGTWSVLEGYITHDGQRDARVACLRVHVQCKAPLRGHVEAPVDQNGYYRKEDGLLPGIYKVWLWIPLDDGERLELAEEVEVVPGEAYKVDFDLPPLDLSAL